MALIPILPSGTFLKGNTYRIERLLGTGGFGAVYLATDLIMSKPCAIKESADTSPGAKNQFEVEARILANLSHPHLVRVTGSFIEPSGKMYMVMEYVEGEDLSDLLDRSGPLPEDKVLAWMEPIFDAVEYLHTYQPRSVIHRDIKPANIRLLPDGKTVKLVDFGIAKIGGAADQTRPAAKGYSPGFSPPEQYGTGTDTYSDVYALGVTLYNLLTGQVPPESIDIAHSGATLQPPRHLNPGISPLTEQVILQAMSIAPAQRYKTAGQMWLALKAKAPTVPTVTCPHCGASVRAGATFCPACGKPVVPPKPFTFKRSGYQAHDVKELVGGCARYWDEGRDAFWRDQFEPWLRSLGEDKLAAQARAIRSRHSDPSAALEEFLERADPTRSKPILTASPDPLDFGTLRRGDTKVLSLTISNSGRGYLHGNLDAKPLAWLSVHPASFGCLAGTQQKIDVEVNTAPLSGTEMPVDYGGTVTVLSNRGQQAVAVRLKVVEEPSPVMDPAQVNLGKVAYGATARGQVTVSNAGGGTLRGTVTSPGPWIAVDSANQTLALSKSRSTVVAFSVDTAQITTRGRHTGNVFVQSSWGRPASRVVIEVDVPFALDPTDPASRVSNVEELRDFCDADWVAGVQHLDSERIEAFLHFIGETALAQTAAQCRQMADRDIGLETFLRAAGAQPPIRYDSNTMDVVGDLGYGPLPRLWKKPTVLNLLIQNKSKRGYLHGRVEPLVPWLSISRPAFGCHPGEIAEIEIHADYQRRKQEARKKSVTSRLFSAGEDLFEIILE